MRYALHAFGRSAHKLRGEPELVSSFLPLALVLAGMWSWDILLIPLAGMSPPIAATIQQAASVTIYAVLFAISCTARLERITQGSRLALDLAACSCWPVGIAITLTLSQNGAPAIAGLLVVRTGGAWMLLMLGSRIACLKTSTAMHVSAASFLCAFMLTNLITALVLPLAITLTAIFPTVALAFAPGVLFRSRYDDGTQVVQPRLFTSEPLREAAKFPIDAAASTFILMCTLVTGVVEALQVTTGSILGSIAVGVALVVLVALARPAHSLHLLMQAGAGLAILLLLLAPYLGQHSQLMFAITAVGSSLFFDLLMWMLIIIKARENRAERFVTISFWLSLLALGHLLGAVAAATLCRMAPTHPHATGLLLTLILMGGTAIYLSRHLREKARGNRAGKRTARRRVWRAAANTSPHTKSQMMPDTMGKTLAEPKAQMAGELSGYAGETPARPADNTNPYGSFRRSIRASGYVPNTLFYESPDGPIAQPGGCDQGNKPAKGQLSLDIFAASRVDDPIAVWSVAADPSDCRLAAFAAKNALTPRQLEVLDMLAQELAPEQIAEELQIKPTTVRVHMHHIVQKLGAASTEDVLRIYRAQSNGR